MASFQKYETKQGIKWLFKMYTTYDPQTGKKKMTTFRGYNTKKEAQKAARIVQDKIDKGILADDKITFVEAYRDWWDTHKRTLKPSTRYKSETIFNKHILPCFGKIRLKQINQDYCQKVIDKWRETLSISTTKDYRGHTQQVFKYAMQHEWIYKNPIQFVIIEKQDEHSLADMEDDETENFWDLNQFEQFQTLAIKEFDYQDFIMFIVMGYSGLRKGEMLTLRWSDLDFKNKVIRVRRTLFFKNKREIIQSTKTGSSKRETPLTDKEIQFLKKWKVMQKEHFLERGIKDIEYVVCRENLKPLRLADPNEILNKFLVNHPELPKIKVHGLRHTFASNLYAAKVDVKTAQKFLGHRRMETTMNIYTHVAKKVKIEEAGKYEDYMKNAKSK
ncbi:site-specific integrase [Sporolactobacillus sp. STSJ-5]|uniref:site-specific integrase n=1 Tax=Sporolactobacillus sp. STSJ-5 TaxID=2965076 RepID=UPI0021047430|nr:site-specific integrase [Sporolactobacillus sp. STSJ-5]MCQ2010588.1 site-specific integrase [Sporolactobacillus sp. STSJ-5]